MKTTTSLKNVVDRNGEHRVARINSAGEWTSISAGCTRLEYHPDGAEQCAGNWLGNSPVEDAQTGENYRADVGREG